MKAELSLTRFQVQIIAAAALVLVVALSLVFSFFFIESHQELTSRTQTRVARVLDSLRSYEQRHGLDALVRFVEDGKSWHDPDQPFVSIRGSGRSGGGFRRASFMSHPPRCRRVIFWSGRARSRRRRRAIARSSALPC
jgi:hypothetical protein